MNTSWKQICTCKSHNIKQVWNMKTSQNHITATPHYYHKPFCRYSYILVVHFTASTIWGLQKLGLIGMVGYHYMFLTFKCFLVYPNLNEVVSVGSNLIWTVIIWPDIYNISRMQIWKKFQICPDGSNCTHVWMKLFQLPKYDWSFWNLPKCL